MPTSNGVRPRTPGEIESARRTRVALVIVVSIVAVAALYLLSQVVLAKVYSGATKSAAGATGQNVAAALDAMGTSAPEALSDPDALHAAYLEQVASPGASQVHAHMRVGILYGRTADRTAQGFGYYACAQSTRNPHLPWGDSGDGWGVAWCVPVNDPNAAPSQPRGGGTFVILNY